MFTLDTNFLVYHAAGDKDTTSILVAHLEKGAHFFLPTIVVLEFFSYPAMSRHDEAAFNSLLRYLNLVSLDFELANMAAFLRRRYKLKLADSVVAATALFTGTTLVTRNARDFQKVPNMALLKV